MLLLQVLADKSEPLATKSHAESVRAAEAAQPSSDFGGAAESSPAEPISAGPAQPTQLSRRGSAGFHSRAERRTYL